MSIKSLKLLVIACSSLVLFSNSNYCYSMEENNINNNGGVGGEEQDSFKSIKSLYQLSMDGELENIEAINNQIIISFNKYKNCKWYKELINEIEMVKFWLKNVREPGVSTSPNMMTSCKNYLKHVLSLPSMLFKYNIFLNIEQNTLLIKLANVLYRTLYVITNTYNILYHLIPKDTIDVNIEGNIEKKNIV